MKNFLCNIIYNWLTSETKLNASEKEHLHYSIRCRYNESYILFWVMLCSVLLNRIIPTAVTVITFNFLRKRAGGLHARTLNQCAVISTFVLAILPYGISFFTVPKKIYSLLFLLAPILFYKYSPTSAHIEDPLPLNYVSRKRKTTLRACAIAVIGIIIMNEQIKCYILCGVYIQLASNLPLIYNYLLKRKMYNHSANTN